MALSSIVLAAALFSQEPRLPGPPPPGLDTSSPAGALIRRAIDFHGGWDVWRSRESVQYRVHVTELGPGGAPTRNARETHKLILRGPPRAQIDFDDDRTALLVDETAALIEDGRPSSDPRLIEEGRLAATASYRLFRLPFSLAEASVSVKLGAESRTRLRATWPPAGTGEQGEWLEAVFSKEGSLESVFYSERRPQGEAYFIMEFQYGDWSSGILKERKRSLFAADRTGAPLRKLQEVSFDEIRFDVPLEIALPKPPIP